MAHTHRYSVHMTSPCVKLTTSCFFNLFFFFFLKTRWVLCLWGSYWSEEAASHEMKVMEAINHKPLWSDISKTFCLIPYLCEDKNALTDCLVFSWLRHIFAVRATSRFMRTRSLSVYLSLRFCGRMRSDLDMCRLAACFPLSAPLPQLVNWKLYSCHLSLSHDHSASLCLTHTQSTHTLATNTWEDKCSVKLNKHNPDMLHSRLSVMKNLHRDAWFHQLKTQNDGKWYKCKM